MPYRRWMSWIDRLVPRACALCGLPTSPGARIGLCPGCLQDLEGATRPRCPRCALPAFGASCECHARFSGLIDQTIAAADYAPALDRLITTMKFARQPALARVLGELVGTAWRGSANTPRIDLLIPVPVSRQRLAERGFNQALEMAWACARFAPRRVRVLPDTLRRERHGRAQSALGRADRLLNLDHAYHCAPLPSGARVALIDDVMTTGTTALAAAQCLRAAGAVWITVMVAARAAHPPLTAQSPATDDTEP